MIKLSQWARQNGINYKTALYWFKSGILPAKAIQLPTGTILIEEEPKAPPSPAKYVIYGRVSSNDQKQDLERQVDRLRLFCAANGYQVSDEVTEIASGMNSNRTKLTKILKDASITHIVVEHKDRLSRFGFELIESTLSANDRSIIVMNATEQEMDLVQDFVDVITSMCARIYGKRSAKNRVQRALKVMEEDDIS